MKCFFGLIKTVMEIPTGRIVHDYRYFFFWNRHRHEISFFTTQQPGLPVHHGKSTVDEEAPQEKYANIQVTDTLTLEVQVSKFGLRTMYRRATTLIKRRAKVEYLLLADNETRMRSDLPRTTFEPTEA